MLPHYTTNSLKVPKIKAGAVIDALRQIDNKITAINFNFIRKPWLRCLSDLSSGKVSAILGSYTNEREKYAVYPKKNGKLDNTRAFSKISTCLIHHKGQLIGWNGKKFEFENSPSIAIPRGYHIGKFFKESGFTVYDTNSSTNAHKLLFSHQVSSSVIDCNNKNFPEFIKMNKRPIETNFGYLIFSKDFYQNNKTLSESLSDEVSKINTDKFNKIYGFK